MKSISFLVNTFGESQVNFPATLESYSNPATLSSPKFKTEVMNEETYYIFEILLIRFEKVFQNIIPFLVHLAANIFLSMPSWFCSKEQPFYMEAYLRILRETFVGLTDKNKEF